MGDRPVRAGGEPLGVLGHPRVVGRGLQRQVERDLHAQPGRPCHEVVKVGERAEVRMDRVVAAGGGADRPRRARIVGSRVQRVVLALARRRPDRMHGRQIHDVEPHRGDRVEPPRRGAQRPRDRPAPAERVNPRALRAREELIPGAEQRPLPVHEQLVPRRAGRQLPERELRERPRHLGGKRAAEPVDRCSPGAAQRPGHLPVQRAGSAGPRFRAAGRELPGGALEQQSALFQHQADILADRDLDRGVVPPVRYRIAPGLHLKVPEPLADRRDVGRVPVGAIG